MAAGCLACSAASDADIRALFWFVNDAYVRRSTPGQSLFWQPAGMGNASVRVVDDRSDQRPLGVSMVE